MSEEKVSIIMGVYNSEKMVEEAIDSILKQTYSNWEFIICDDASTDRTYEILLQYEKNYPNKFVILRNKENAKLAYSLNRCLEHVTGKYVARMDADDLSLPTRLEFQVHYLKEHPDVHLVGTAMQRFDEKGFKDIDYGEKNPTRYSMKGKAPFKHATIMTYRNVFEQLNGYTVSKLTNRAEDRELWFRFFQQGFKGDNLMMPLYLVREDKQAIRRRTMKTRYYSYLLTMKGFKLLGYPYHWYIRSTIIFLLKASTPSVIQEYYRKYQGIKYNKMAALKSQSMKSRWAKW